jgi:hypothetical protein
MLEAVRVKDRVKEDFYKRGPNGMDWSASSIGRERLTRL